jgi:hypothetical protein
MTKTNTNFRISLLLRICKSIVEFDGRSIGLSTPRSTQEESPYEAGINQDSACANLAVEHYRDNHLLSIIIAKSEPFGTALTSKAYGEIGMLGFTCTFVAQGRNHVFEQVGFPE